MKHRTRDFYDELAENYHWIFQDWEASMARQAAALEQILERERGAAARSIRILDCACGIGTQALGLAQRGFRVTASDVSAGAVGRARREAEARGLALTFFVADMRRLTEVPEFDFDVVIAMDNALPHLDSDQELVTAATQVRSKLRTGGTFLASIRDYDQAIAERPVVHGPVFYDDSGGRRIVFQLWDWADERRYTLHLYITRQTTDGWRTDHGVTQYRAVLRSEMAHVLEQAGYRNVRWSLPEESGFYQPVVLATA